MFVEHEYNILTNSGFKNVIKHVHLSRFAGYEGIIHKSEACSAWLDDNMIFFLLTKIENDVKKEKRRRRKYTYAIIER